VVSDQVFEHEAASLLFGSPVEDFHLKLLKHIDLAYDEANDAFSGSVSYRERDPYSPALSI